MIFANDNVGNANILYEMTALGGIRTAQSHSIHHYVSTI